MAGFALGFAVGGVAEPVSMKVPYTAVRGLVREGQVLYLALDPALVTPYNRFALAGFTDHLDAGPGDPLAQASIARARARWASRLLPVPLGAIAAALAPDDSGRRRRRPRLVRRARGPDLRSRPSAASWRGRPSAASGPNRLRDLFEAELRERLALAPASSPAVEPEVVRRLAAKRPASAVQLIPLLSPARPAASAVPPPAPPARRAAWPLAAASAAALGIVGVMALLAHLASPHPPPPAAPLLLSGLGAAVRGARPGLRARAEPERCVCTRADSPLWKDGIPHLGILTFHGEEGLSRPLTPAADRSGHMQYGFDIAVVNDSSRPLRDIRLTLTFARRNEAGRRVGAVDRGLFWGSVLAPGAAVKWKVAAPGTEVRLDASVTGTLAAAYLDPAPPDAFARLLSSHFRAVRAHGALMLAYLRDPRADAAVRALEAQGATSKEDGALLARIRRAAAPVFACEVHRAGARVDACVFNASSRPRSGFLLEAVAPDGATAKSFPVEVALPVHEGRRVGVEVPEALGSEIRGGGAALSPAGERGVSPGTSRCCRCWCCWGGYNCGSGSRWARCRCSRPAAGTLRCRRTRTR